jgi:hypothetical protein
MMWVRIPLLDHRGPETKVFPGLTNNMIEGKVCNKCGNNLPLIKFKKKKYGRSGTCRKCKPATSRYQQRNRLRREEYRNKFGSKCEICSEISNLNIDHDHNTQVIRGVLCRKCNWALGLLKDNTNYLKKAIEYLDRPRPNPELLDKNSNNGY